MTPTYLIAPDCRGGYSLSGPKLPWTLHWKDDAHAADYAVHMLRDTGGRIVVLGSHGYHLITEHVPEPEGGVRRCLYDGRMA